MDCHTKVSEILVMFEKVYLVENQGHDYVSFVLELLNRAYKSNPAVNRESILVVTEKIN